MVSPRSENKINKQVGRYNTENKAIQIIEEEGTDSKKPEEPMSSSLKKTKSMRKQHMHNNAAADGGCSFHAEMDQMFKKGSIS